jgi:hypothetical protein
MRCSPPPDGVVAREEIRVALRVVSRLEAADGAVDARAERRQIGPGHGSLER